VTLEDVCYKPFAGGACATQSLLQYWRMDQSIYKKGDPTSHARLSPEYCLSHWSTACLGAYGGPQVRKRTQLRLHHNALRLLQGYILM
jgi:Niemann-Pick C1 protein